MPRSFAIVPAAGHSTRMGQPKLLMPLAGQALIAHAINAWRRGRVDQIVVVVRADDVALAKAVRSLLVPNVDLVQPEVAPPDMKASIQAALKHIERQHAPTVKDCFLVAPADMPRISPAIIQRLLAQYARQSDQILIPTLAGVRGHPVLFPWSLAAEVYSLPEGEGLNSLLRRHEPILVACDDLVAENEQSFADIDTLEEYRRLAGE